GADRVRRGPRRARRARHPPPRVTVADDGAAGRAGRAVDAGRGDQPAVHREHRVPEPVAGARRRRQRAAARRGHRHQVGAGHRGGRRLAARHLRGGHGLPAAPGQGGRAGGPGPRLLLRRVDHPVRGRSGHGVLQRGGLVRHPHHRRRRERGGPPRGRRRAPPAARPVRGRPLLPPGARHRRGGRAPPRHPAGQPVSPSLPILTAPGLLPAAGALAVAIVPRPRPELFRGVALLFAFATGALTVWLMAAFDRHDAGYQFVVNRSWVSEFGISWHVGIDAISLFLIVLAGLLVPLAMLGSPPPHAPKPYYAWLLLLEAGCLGVFISLDLFLFFVMFEIVLVPMYFLIGGWGYANRVYA